VRPTTQAISRPRPGPFRNRGGRHRKWHRLLWAPYYSDRERAALGWTEALTRLSDGHKLENAREALKAQFSEEEQVKLTLMINVIIGSVRDLALPASSHRCELHHDEPEAACVTSTPIFLVRYTRRARRASL